MFVLIFSFSLPILSFLHTISNADASPGLIGGMTAIGVCLLLLLLFLAFYRFQKRA